MRTVAINKIKKHNINWKQHDAAATLRGLGPAAENWPADVYHQKLLDWCKRNQNGSRLRVRSWRCPIKNRIYVWKARH